MQHACDFLLLIYHCVPQFTSLAKWLSVCLRHKLFWDWLPLQLLSFQLLLLFWAWSLLTFRWLHSVDSPYTRMWRVKTHSQILFRLEILLINKKKRNKRHVRSNSRCEVFCEKGLMKISKNTQSAITPVLPNHSLIMLQAFTPSDLLLC